MQIEFRPIEYGKDYDIVHNLDKSIWMITPYKYKMKYIDMQIKRRKRGLLNAGYFQLLPQKMIRERQRKSRCLISVL